MNIKQLLLSLGYRELGKVMVKPIGYNCFKFNFENNTISSHFFGNGTVKELLCWDKKKITHFITKEDFLFLISEFEQYYVPSSSKYFNFAFRTTEEIAMDICNGL